MLRELIEGLSQEQKRELAALGVPHPRLSEWKHGKGVPSRRAVAALAQVTGADVMEIEREVMALEMKPEDREIFRGILKIPTGAMTALILILGMGFPAEKANADNDLGKSHDSAGIHIVASMFSLRVRCSRCVDCCQALPKALAPSTGIRASQPHC